jgi:hypothetical protein
VRDCQWSVVSENYLGLMATLAPLTSVLSPHAGRGGAVLTPLKTTLNMYPNGEKGGDGLCGALSRKIALDLWLRWSLTSVLSPLAGRGG